MKKVFLSIIVAAVLILGLNINLLAETKEEKAQTEQNDTIAEKDVEKEVVEEKKAKPDNVDFHHEMRRKINTLLGNFQMQTYQGHEESAIRGWLIHAGIYITYGLIILAAFASIAFPVFQFVKDIRKARGTLIGLAILLIVVFIAYLFASGKPYEEQNVGEVVSRWIGTGILTTFILVGIGFAAAIYTEVSKLFK